MMNASPKVLFRAGIIFYVLFTCLTLQLPFFGDHVSVVSGPANYFYRINFRDFILPDEINSGHPPFYSMLFAVMWKVFGRTLAVSHIISAITCIFLFYQYYLLCKKILNDKQTGIAIVLFLLQPTILAQISLMSTDILLCGLFLLGLNAILSEKRKLLMAAILFSMLISFRGWMIVGFLFIADMILTRQFKKQMISIVVQYLIGIVPALLWYLYSYYETGWFLINPSSPWSEGRVPVSIQTFPGKVFEYTLRFLEFGMIIPWLFILFLSRRGFSDGRYRKYFILLFTGVLFFSIFIIFFKNPVLVRYILPLQLLALILFSWLISEYASKKFRTAAIGITCVLFISHHFFAYPQMRSSVFEYSWGEGSLAHLSYFKFREKGLEYLLLNDIPLQEVYTGFPEYKNFDDTGLNGGRFNYNTLHEENITSCKYIIYSNIMNDITKETETELKNNWTRLQTFYEYPVEYIIFKNPAE